MADSRRKFNMATILNDEARTVGIWGCKNGLTVKKYILWVLESMLYHYFAGPTFCFQDGGH